MWLYCHSRASSEPRRGARATYLKDADRTDSLLPRQLLSCDEGDNHYLAITTCLDRLRACIAFTLVGSEGHEKRCP